MQRAAEAALCDPLTQDAPRDQWKGGQPTAQQRALVRTLREHNDELIAVALDTGRTSSALEFWTEFMADSQRVPFVDPGENGGKEYNQETLWLFAQYIRKRGSRKKGQLGQRVRAGTVEGYVSAIKVLRERTARRAITPDDGLALGLLYKRFRKEDGPAGERRLSRGIRAHMLRRLVDMGYDRSSACGLLKWAAALVAHNLLLRGGEVGSSKGDFDAMRGIAFASIKWRPPCAETKGAPWMTVDVVSIKDVQMRNSMCRMPIRRRSADPDVRDPLCTYDAIRRHWDRQMAGLSIDEQRKLATSRRAFFAHADGTPWRTDDSKDLAREMAEALGENGADFGGKAFRIGGATDLRDVLGAAAIQTIKQRGRWWSDIALIYQRLLLAEHLNASVSVGESSSRDMESLGEGWAQSANMR